MRSLKTTHHRKPIVKINHGLLGILPDRLKRWSRSHGGGSFFLKLEINEEGDLRILEKLDDYAGLFRCKDIIVAMGKKAQKNSSVFLNAIPLIARHLKKKKPGITIRHINPVYFDTQVPIDQIESLIIEPNNTCNLSCEFCRTGRGEQTHPAHMSFQTFKNIIGQFPLLPRTTHLYGRGEPFLNGDLFKMVSYVKLRGGSCVSVSTNGHFLCAENIRRLMESKMDKLIVSLDSVRKGTYRLLRRGGDLSRVIQGLKRLSHLKKEGIQRPEIILQYVISKQNETEIDEMKDFALSLGFKAEFRSISTQNEKLLPFNHALRRNERSGDKKDGSVNFCTAPWDKLVISCRGIVTLCPKSLNPSFFDMEGSPLAMGDIRRNPLEQIWNGKKYQALRETMLKNKHKIGCPVRCPNPDFSLTAKLMEHKRK